MTGNTRPERLLGVFSLLLSRATYARVLESRLAHLCGAPTAGAPLVVNDIEIREARRQPKDLGYRKDGGVIVLRDGDLALLGI